MAGIHHLLTDQILDSLPWVLGCSASQLDCNTLGRVIQAITSHNYVNYHGMKLGETQSPTCRFCGENCEEFIDMVLRTHKGAHESVPQTLYFRSSSESI